MFSDGVIVIAITLLVLDLHVPEAAGAELGQELAAQWPTYVAYVASFATIGIMWVNHHVIFTTVARVDRVTLFLNLLLLFGIATLPFTTSLAATYLSAEAGADLAVALYAGWLPSPEPAAQARSPDMSPAIDPSGLTRTRSAAGSRGRPGIVTLNPVLATTNPAPADSRASRTVIGSPLGTPRTVGSSLSDRCVLAMHTGRLAPTAEVILPSSASARRLTSISCAP